MKALKRVHLFKVLWFVLRVLGAVRLLMLIVKCVASAGSYRGYRFGRDAPVLDDLFDSQAYHVVQTLRGLMTIPTVMGWLSQPRGWAAGGIGRAELLPWRHEAAPIRAGLAPGLARMLGSAARTWIVLDDVDVASRSLSATENVLPCQLPG